jgi:hypothetical protein
MSSNTFIPIGTSYYSGLYDENGLTIAKADQRYIRIGGNGFMSSVFANTINATDYQVNGVSADLSALVGFSYGIPTPNKCLILNSNNQITDQLRFNNTNIRVDRTVNGSFLQSFNGTSSFNMFHFNNGSVVIGTSSAHTISFQTNNQGRLTIDSAGAVAVAGGLSCASLTVNGAPISSNTLPAITPSTATIGGFSVSGVIWHSTQDRLYTMRQINNNEFSLLSYSSGGSFSDRITFNHNSGLPIINLYGVQYGLLNQDLGNNSTNRLQIGKARSTDNSYELIFNHIGNANILNRLDIRPFGRTNGISINGNGRVGINQTTPTCPLEISGFASVQLAPTAFQDGFRYNISTGNWANLGMGPLSVDTTLRVNGNAWIQNNIYANSDRRLKHEIESLDFDLSHYDKLNPVSYRWKSDSDKNKPKCLGLVAQDVHSICAEAISFIPNESLKKVEEGDIEGYTMTVDYNSIHIMSVVAIKKLINVIGDQQKQIDELDLLVKTLMSRPVVAKWMEKNKTSNI